MSTTVFLAVLAAALMHAAWNSVVKLGADRLSSVLSMALVQGLAALPLLPGMPWPTPDAWLWVVAAALLHAGYKLFLIQAYTHADLSQAYPLARGAAPLTVAVYSVVVLGVVFSGAQVLAIGLISAGILLMAVRGSLSGWMGGRALAFALGTALFTAAYTLVDGLGARIAGTASGFYLWMVVGDAVLMALWAVRARGWRVFPALLPDWRSGLVTGVCSMGAYWISIWAFTQAPIALVAALRESSIFFAVVIAAVVLREPVSRWRWASAVVIVAGVGAMK